MTPGANHRILIEHAAAGFSVRIDPLVSGASYDATYPTHKQARGYASGLRLAHRWPIVDLASDAALADMLGDAK